MPMRTPMSRVRGLGSAKEGTDHFWVQRLTAIANLFLVVFLIALVVRLVGSDYASMRALLASPFVSLGLLLLIISGTIHMRLGMQTIIEDYVHAEGWKILALVANTFFAILIALISIISIMKLSFGA